MAIDAELYYWKVQESTPGKFEGETPATAYYWDSYLNGDGEWLGTFSLFVVTDEEREAFDIASECGYFLVQQDESGFIYGHEATEQMVAGLRNEHDERNAEADKRIAAHAFEQAISEGRLSEDTEAANWAGDYMYMGALYNGVAMFKNRDTRQYLESGEA